MNALSTMLLISDAFVELCDEMPLRKVSISDIVERTGKNRKTFYYHFENKDRLIIWIFRYDMGQCLPEDMEYVIANKKLSEEFDIASTHMLLVNADLPDSDVRAMIPPRDSPTILPRSPACARSTTPSSSSASPRCWRDAATSTARRSWTTAPTRCATTCTRCTLRP